MIVCTGKVAKVEKIESKNKPGEYRWSMRIIDDNLNVHDLVQFKTDPGIKQGENIAIELDEKTSGYIKKINRIK